MWTFLLSFYYEMLSEVDIVDIIALLQFFFLRLVKCDLKVEGKVFLLGCL